MLYVQQLYNTGTPSSVTALRTMKQTTTMQSSGWIQTSLWMTSSKQRSTHRSVVNKLVSGTQQSTSTHICSLTLSTFINKTTQRSLQSIHWRQHEPEDGVS